jgi:hypothetical protein
VEAAESIEAIEAAEAAIVHRKKQPNSLPPSAGKRSSPRLSGEAAAGRRMRGQNNFSERNNDSKTSGKSS